MKAIINGFVIAFAMYSKIPMPKVEWSKENMKYAICFFPLIGVVIGAVMYGLSIICFRYGFGQLSFALIGAVIPILITGGIHLDGFMDTSDALHSYQPKEKKLEIMKDAHIGAFAVIAAAVYFLSYAGGLALIWKEKQLLLLGIGYIISRTLSGMALVWFPGAKKEGLVYTFVSQSHKQTVRVCLLVVLVLCFITCIIISPIMGVLESLLCMWVWTYYYYMSKREFGGITGDLAGYFLTLCELAVVLFVGMFGRVLL